MWRPFIIVFTLFSPFAFAEISADSILKKSDAGKMPPGESLSFKATVKEFKEQDLVKETRYEVLTKGRENSLVSTTYPERQQGRKLLMEGDNMWIYTPDIRRPARISPNQKLTGEVSNGDIARTDFYNDYTPKLLGIEDFNGHKIYHLDLLAKRKDVTYPRIEYWVTAQDFLPLKAVFYSFGGKVLKTGYYSSVKVVMGHKCVTQLKIIDALAPSHYSIMSYNSHKKVRVPDRLLAKESLDD